MAASEFSCLSLKFGSNSHSELLLKEAFCVIIGF